MGMLGDQCHMEIEMVGRSQEVPIATKKFNKASIDDQDTSRWLLWDLQGDGAREIRSSKVAGELVPKGTGSFLFLTLMCTVPCF